MPRVSFSPNLLIANRIVPLPGLMYPETHIQTLTLFLFPPSNSTNLSFHRTLHSRSFSRQNTRCIGSHDNARLYHPQFAKLPSAAAVQAQPPPKPVIKIPAAVVAVEADASPPFLTREGKK